MLDCTDRFSYIEPSLHPWAKDYLTVVNDVSDVFLDLLCKNFIEYFFSSMFIREIGLKFSFFVEPLCGLGISITVASKKELGRVPFVSILWNSVKNIGIISSLNVW